MCEVLFSVALITAGDIFIGGYSAVDSVVSAMDAVGATVVGVVGSLVSCSVRD